VIYERNCKTCDEVKPLGQFNQYAPGKYRYVCKACQMTNQRKYQKRYDEKKRLKKLVEGTPTMQQRLDALEAQVQSLLAFASLHGYNTTET
jgi:transposase-like protein